MKGAPGGGHGRPSAPREHFTKDLEATVAFYVEAVGLTKGERPPFGFPGAWLYDGALPAVHLTLAAEPRAGAAAAVDHVAFAYDALDQALARLDRLNMRYTPPKHVPGTSIRQCFVKDPNGVTVESHAGALRRALAQIASARHPVRPAAPGDSRSRDSSSVQ
jgi:catechol 2,3-dioxygenase-like lactoylglutathione lyase family enzyme